jgi:hypothetical protein
MMISEGTLVRVKQDWLRTVGIPLRRMQPSEVGYDKRKKLWWVKCIDDSDDNDNPTYLIEEKCLKPIAYLTTKEVRMAEQGKISVRRVLVAHLSRIVAELL